MPGLVLPTGHLLPAITQRSANQVLQRTPVEKDLPAQSTHWSTVPATRAVPAAHAGHCELPLLVQVASTLQFVMLLHLVPQVMPRVEEEDQSWACQWNKTGRYFPYHNTGAGNCKHRQCSWWKRKSHHSNMDQPQMCRAWWCRDICTHQHCLRRTVEKRKTPQLDSDVKRTFPSLHSHHVGGRKKNEIKIGKVLTIIVYECVWVET